MQAIREAVKDLKQNGQAGKPKLIFLLTDGLPTDRDAAGAAFAEAKAAGVRVQVCVAGYTRPFYRSMQRHVSMSL